MNAPYVSSLNRFRESATSSDGQPLSWGRIDQDGMPFRGQPSLMSNAEYAQSVAPVLDVKVRFFDVSDAIDKLEYERILTSCLSGLYQPLYVKRPGELDPAKPVLAYIEYAERYMQNVKQPTMVPVNQTLPHKDVHHVLRTDVLVARFEDLAPQGSNPP